MLGNQWESVATHVSRMSDGRIYVRTGALCQLWQALTSGGGCKADRIRLKLAFEPHFRDQGCGAMMT
jgi:hypothetical protein